MPEQKSPQAPRDWQAIRLSGTAALAVRASKKLRTEELLVTSLGSTILRKYLEEIRRYSDPTEVRQLAEDFALYPYLPRLTGQEGSAAAFDGDGMALLTWRTDTFALAESFDEAAGRYRGLRGGKVVTLVPESRDLLVKPNVVRQQMEQGTIAFRHMSNCQETTLIPR